MQNFATLARQFLRHEGALEAADPPALRAALQRLFSDADLRARMAANAARCLEVHRGATRRTVEAIERVAPFHPA